MLIIMVVHDNTDVLMTTADLGGEGRGEGRGRGALGEN